MHAAPAAAAAASARRGRRPARRARGPRRGRCPSVARASRVDVRRRRGPTMRTTSSRTPAASTPKPASSRAPRRRRRRGGRAAGARCRSSRGAGRPRRPARQHDGLAGVVREALEHQPSNRRSRPPPCLRCTACLETPSARADLLPRPAPLARVGDVQRLEALDQGAQRGDRAQPDLRGRCCRRRRRDRRVCCAAMASTYVDELGCQPMLTRPGHAPDSVAGHVRVRDRQPPPRRRRRDHRAQPARGAERLERAARATTCWPRSRAAAEDDDVRAVRHHRRRARRSPPAPTCKRLSGRRGAHARGPPRRAAGS